MPKKLDSIRQRAVAHTRAVLQTQGYDALAMREVAAACGIAVGTMYNYFPSKEYLTGCVVLEDWQQAYAHTQALAASAQSLEAGLQAIYEQLAAFVQAHQYLTAYDRRKAGGKYDFPGQHVLLRGQVEALITPLLHRFGCRPEQELLTFLAESMLNCAVKQFAYSQIALPLRRLLT